MPDIAPPDSKAHGVARVSMPPLFAGTTGTSAAGVPGGGWARQVRLPLAFMALGLVWLVIGAVLLAFHPEVLLLAHTSPSFVALAHAWILGVMVSVACGAAYQLAPVALGTSLAGERRAWWHLGLHAAGVPGMVYAFYKWDMARLGHFGFAVAMGVGLFADTLWRTVRSAKHPSLVGRSLALAAGWLLLTVVAGLIVASNACWHFIPVNPLALLRAHAHLALVGFFVTLLQGVSFHLVAMFTLGEVRRPRHATWGLWLTQIALLGLVPSLALDVEWLSFFFSIVALVGLASSGWAFAATVASRRKRRLDPGLLGLIAGICGVGVAGLSGVALLWPGMPWGSAPGGFSANVYGLLVVVGAFLPAILGMMCKVVPFLTWMLAYGPRVGRSATPAAHQMTHPRIEGLGLALALCSVGPLAAGAWTLSLALVQAGVVLLLAAVALIIADMVLVLRHLFL